jgi:RNA recognition motif-containing protein
MSDWVQVYVRGYPKRVGEQDLKKFFSRFGKAQEVRLMYDFAFVVTQ